MIENRHFTLAIDGPCGAGKSTIARACAHKTGALYLDTGAMYRAIGLAALRRGIDMQCDEAILAVAQDSKIDVQYVQGEQHICLNGEDVSLAIRRSDVSMAASRVSAVAQVRQLMVAQQQQIARGKSVVMDGRDIGTKVLPDATLKIFLQADPAVRARRRFLEMQQKGSPECYEAVYQALVKRDYDDTHRAASPLEPAQDALVLDSTEMTFDQTVEKVLSLLTARLEEEA